MIINAILSNSITNALHATFLFFYTMFAIINFLKGDKRFTGMIMICFLGIFILKIAGIFAHYYNYSIYHNEIWLFISLMMVFSSYCFIYSMKASDNFRISTVAFCILCAGLFINLGNFMFLALMLLFTYSGLAFFSKNWTKYALIGAVISNITWIIMRSIGDAYFGGSIPVEYRYDNDIYHFMLIASSFVLYKSISHGDWQSPND